ncbi:MAG: replication-associated recombination protein A [Alphaproteobacteria bacterium]|nr:replication-associated recombination protein A [Alphaproteobacteria bacterium]MBP7759046.1 replication-associated recombination protein A [Alphaproteobacteria bacterium]MBP7762320.1 replication-associated recombination protein A [Alphaproteobacteria bacterium]MBP7905530.1 replication-associated recombination protein A [Alphaproteobacteria bacterium]
MAGKAGEKAGPRPLADRLRPAELGDVVGQDHLLGPGGPLRKMADSGVLASMILWGPPGCGKTTLARILARHSGLHFEQISAIFSGVAELRRVFDSARIRHQNGQGTLLFVDEIHRFNKSQQDAFLPVMEDGTITLIGATTENPSFELNAALLSRAQVFVLKRLDESALDSLIERAEKEAGEKLPLTPEARDLLKTLADGDGRYILSMTEQMFAQSAKNKTEIDPKALLELVQRRAPLYDKGDDAHYNLISALHKTVRGSDADAALYWFARMLAGGEDPRYIARRMVRMAVEDIGLAEPQALQTTLAAWEAYERLGSPEGELALAQALVFLATAPKSNAAYTAYKSAQKAAKETGSLMPPKHILNAPTKLMKTEGYGAGYAYDHDAPDSFSGQNYFPDGMKREEFYKPVERGFEREIKKRLEYWSKLRSERGGK